MDFSKKLKTYDQNSCRFVFAANAIVAVYSLFEMVVSVWEISRGSTLLPEILQVWFDFGHDQVQTPNPKLPYPLLSVSDSLWYVCYEIFLFNLKLKLWSMNSSVVCMGCDPLGLRVPATVGELGGNSVGKSTETDGHVYGHERVLHPVGHLDRPGIRRIPVPRVFIPALGISRRQFHNQRLSCSSLNGEDKIRQYLCVSGCCFFYRVPYYITIWLI